MGFLQAGRAPPPIGGHDDVGYRQMVACPLPDAEPAGALSPTTAGGARARVRRTIFEKISDVNRAGPPPGLGFPPPTTIVMVEQTALRALGLSKPVTARRRQERLPGRGRLLSDDKVAELYLGGSARMRPAEQA